MCFKATKSARAKIAKTDIECWKMVNRNLTNAFSKWIEYRIHYTKGEKMPKVKLMVRQNDIMYFIREGYHSFKNKPPRGEKKSGWLLDNCYRTIIKKFIIPAGTRYFENKTEYVSETIMLVE